MNDRPTHKQLQYLHDLAHKTGQPFPTPRTKREASHQIDRLQKITNSPIARANRRRQAHTIMAAIRAEIAAATPTTA